MTYRPPPGSIPTLPVPDLGGFRRVHMIGIGGAGMSGIARLLLARGIEVSGSDLKGSVGLDDLGAMGATVFVGHRAEQVGTPDAVVVSTAIPEHNPELAEARGQRLPVLARAQVLAALMAGTRGVAVAGTHGKTTTTSMASVILERAGLDPTFVIGGDLNESGSNARHGDGGWFVAEADESDGSFLLLARGWRSPCRPGRPGGWLGAPTTPASRTSSGAPAGPGRRTSTGRGPTPASA